MKIKKMYLRTFFLLVIASASLTNATGQTLTKTFTFNFDAEDFRIEQISSERKCEIISDLNYGIGELGEPNLPHIVYDILLPDNYRIHSFTYSVGDDTCRINRIFFYPTAEEFLNNHPDTLTADSIPLYPTPLTVSGPGPHPDAPQYPLKTFPTKVQHTGNQKWDNYVLERFTICPFTYYAVEQKLVLSTSFNLTVSIVPDDNGTPSHTGQRDEWIKEITYNLEDFGKGAENWTLESIADDKVIALEGKEWHLSHVMPHIVSYVYDIKQWIDGDTLVDGQSCKKLYTLTTTEDERIARKEVLEVGYCRQEGDKFYQNGTLMFDFGLKEGDVFSFGEENIYAVVTHVGDTTLTDGVTRKCLTLRHYHPEWNVMATTSDKWIEGIGSLKKGIYDNLFMAAGYNTTMLSCTHNNMVIYEKENNDIDRIEYILKQSAVTIRAIGQTLFCTSPTAVKIEVYTMDAIKVGEAAFISGEATVKVDKVPTTCLYIVTYPNGRRESGKVVVK